MPASIEIVSSTVPLLEAALEVEEGLAEIDPKLRLRGPVCGLATGALVLYMREMHGVALERIVTYSEKAPREYNFRRASHVMLDDGNTLYDPTYSQFLKYVGLTPQVAQANEQLSKLYPNNPLAAFSPNDAERFADSFAAYTHDIEPLLLVGTMDGGPAVGALRSKSIEEKQEVYRDIWNPAHYDILPINDQPALSRRAEKVMRRLAQLAVLE